MPAHSISYDTQKEIFEKHLQELTRIKQALNQALNIEPVFTITRLKQELLDLVLLILVVFHIWPAILGMLNMNLKGELIR